jgi:hypothetical protein
MSSKDLSEFYNQYVVAKDSLYGEKIGLVTSASPFSMHVKYSHDDYTPFRMGCDGLTVRLANANEIQDFLDRMSRTAPSSATKMLQRGEKLLKALNKGQAEADYEYNTLERK